LALNQNLCNFLKLKKFGKSLNAQKQTSWRICSRTGCLIFLTTNLAETSTIKRCARMLLRNWRGIRQFSMESASNSQMLQARDYLLKTTEILVLNYNHLIIMITHMRYRIICWTTAWDSIHLMMPCAMGARTGIRNWITQLMLICLLTIALTKTSPTPSSIQINTTKSTAAFGLNKRALTTSQDTTKWANQITSLPFNLAALTTPQADQPKNLICFIRIRITRPYFKLQALNNIIISHNIIIA